MIHDPRLRHVFWLVAELFAAVLLALALFVIVVRVALPHADNFKPQIEQWASSSFGLPVRIGAVAAYWPGIDLTIVVDRVELLDDDGATQLEFARAHLDLDLLASLLLQEPVVNELHLDGLVLNLAVGPDGLALGGGEAPPPGAATARDAGDGLGWFLPWLLSQRQVDLTSGRLHWHGSDAESRQFGRFSLRTRNRGDDHRLALSLAATDGPQQIDLAADFSGPAADAGRWQGKFYTRAQQVDWPSLLALADAAMPADLDLGGLQDAVKIPEATRLPTTVDLEVWFDVDDGGVTRAAGEAAFSAPAGDHPGGLGRFAGRFDWRPDVTGWRVDLDGIELQTAGGDGLRLGPVGLRLVEEGVGAVTFEAGLASLDVTSLRRLTELAALLPPDLADALAGLRPSGQLYNLRGSWNEGSDGDLSRWRVTGELWDLATVPWRDWPGIDGVRLQFDADPQGGVVGIFGSGASVTLPRLFREPLPIDRLEGEVAIRRDDDGWRLAAEEIVAANDHITTRTRVEALLPTDGDSPFIDLEVGYRDGDIAEVWRYLPVGIMGDGVVAWLDQALVGGRVVEGGMLLHGPLDRFPFDGYDGHFEVRFLVDGMTLDYLEGWPPIRDLTAWGKFDGRRMEIEGQLAQIFGARLERVTARIADLTADDPALVIEGNAYGDAGEGLRYLRESPLRDAFGDYLAVAEGSGRMALGLRLDVPLGDGETAVKGRIDLDDAVLDLPAFGIKVSKARGRLEFSDDTLTGRDLTADWLGMPVTVDVLVPDRTEGGGGGPRITARGVAGEAQLAEWLPVPLRERIAGEFAWTTVVSVSEDVDGDVSGVGIRVDSDLAGLALDLPEPLGKARDEARALTVDARLPEDRPPLLRVRHGPLSLVAELDQAEGDIAVPRAELRVGSGEAVLPDRPLWRIDFVSEATEFVAWRELLAGFVDDATAVAETPLLELHARLDAFPLGDALTLHDVDATVTGDPGMWRVALVSREIEGQLQLPRTGGREAPIVAELARVAFDFDLDATSDDNVPESDTPGPDPRTLPGLRIDIDALVVNGEDLGAFSLIADPYADGLRFTRLRLDDELWTVLGSGRWTRTDAEGELSAFNLTLEATDLDRLATAVGLEGQVDFEYAEYSANLTWPGAPDDIALATVAGSLHGELTNGVLKEVSPGVGRVFSLVNMRQLGRRLTLDFSDLFDSGTQFDSISGNFTFDDGNAYTNDLLIVTSAATINIMGRTGLVVRDYDQLMTVLPHVSGTLPIAGAVLGGPLVGAALLLFDQAFSQNVDRLVQAQYAITGSWDAPEVTRVTSPQEAPERETSGAIGPD